jgi:dipeptidyl aminopeptidase/acylaminoacyl peptidase
MKRYNFILLLCAIFSLIATITYGQEVKGYQIPPKDVTDIILAPLTPSVYFNQAKSRYLFAEGNDIPTVEEMMQEDVRLAGVRALKATNAPRFRTSFTKISVMNVPGQHFPEGEITGFPSEARVVSLDWANDDKNVIATIEYKDGIKLWIVDMNTLVAKELSSRTINLFIGGIAINDKAGIITVTCIPEGRKAMSERKREYAPVVQESVGKVAAVRTYQDLLTDSYSEELFDWYATSELVNISFDGNESVIGAPANYSRLSYSPDGQWLVVNKIVKPYSYQVPFYNFPSVVEVWSSDCTTKKVVAEIPLSESSFKGRNSTSPFPRGFSWRSDVPASLYWIEPLDGGNGLTKVAYRDMVKMWNAPFEGEAEDLFLTTFRFSGITWGDANNAFYYTSDRESKVRELYHFNPSDKRSQLVNSENTEDLYGAWGSIVTNRNEYGKYIAYSNDKFKTIFFEGDGYSPDGAKPFIDKYDLKKEKKTRIWSSENPYYETPIAYIDLAKGKFITKRESVSEYPNYFLKDLKKRTTTQITSIENPYKSLDGVTKETIHYKRADGVDLSGTLYLPAGFKKGDKPLPVFMWAYPAEFKSSADAGQRRDSPNRFTRVGRTSIIVWVTQGYAVLDGASFPIIGENGEEPNDTYIEQLTANAQAAINTLVDMGVADRNKIAVGGHSYGGFMTANLLANTDLFAAGIARSGAYNRTLTPFGFQNEQRTFWEAEDVYMKMSPFASADKLKTPILLIHGQDDNNSGTFTVQSERLYAAVKGNGGIVRLVLLPGEAHGYQAKESILHQAWETYQWLERFVKNGKVKE